MFVFLHGVPESAAIWDKVRTHLDVESVALGLPGFARERPPGFAATKDDYVQWLLSELDRFDEPVDLVGHDWGAGLTYRVATVYGERLHSWCADIANIMHPDYVWHHFAQIWQTPGDGEAFFETQLAVTPEQRGAGYEALGVAHDDAILMAGALDATMGECILDLYRSATPNVFAHWGDQFTTTNAPGMVIHRARDPFGDETMSRAMAACFGASHHTLEDVGHWWPLEDPAQAAAMLRDFHDSLG